MFASHSVVRSRKHHYHVVSTFLIFRTSMGEANVVPSLVTRDLREARLYWSPGEDIEQTVLALRSITSPDTPFVSINNGLDSSRECTPFVEALAMHVQNLKTLHMRAAVDWVHLNRKHSTTSRRNSHGSKCCVTSRLKMPSATSRRDLIRYATPCMLWYQPGRMFAHRSKLAVFTNSPAGETTTGSGTIVLERSSTNLVVKPSGIIDAP
ncbi:hypothetical protein MSAN_01070900 [Mycena sanguinolenta]|uniref:Uncharacterized protein n=1 Tax=Mycena sanguinolenta TaxID=230812 RepID=A0A8H6YQ28_9AGAR|nr:hypothetical protein MSAN_01070900 [Mycena sanguinolenta]